MGGSSAEAGRRLGVLRVATLRWVNIPHRDSQFHKDCAADVVAEGVERRGRQIIEVDP